LNLFGRGPGLLGEDGDGALDFGCRDDLFAKLGRAFERWPLDDAFFDGERAVDFGPEQGRELGELGDSRMARQEIGEVDGLAEAYEGAAAVQDEVDEFAHAAGRFGGSKDLSPKGFLGA